MNDSLHLLAKFRKRLKISASLGSRNAFKKFHAKIPNLETWENYDKHARNQQ